MTLSPLVVPPFTTSISHHHEQGRTFCNSSHHSAPTVSTKRIHKAIRKMYYHSTLQVVPTHDCQRNFSSIIHASSFHWHSFSSSRNLYPTWVLSHYTRWAAGKPQDQRHLKSSISQSCDTQSMYHRPGSLSVLSDFLFLALFPFHV